MSSTAIDDLYGILGVAENAGGEEIRRNYKRLARELHPDRFIGDSLAQERAQEQFSKVSNAYNVLKNAQSRSEYDFERKMLRQRELDEGVEEVDAPVEESGYKRGLADRQYREALHYQAEGDLDRAIEALKAATELCPRIAQYRALLGALYGKRGWQSYAEAELKKAIRLDPHDDLSKKLYRKIVAHGSERTGAKASSKGGKNRRKSDRAGKTGVTTASLKGTHRFRKKRQPFWMTLFHKLWHRRDSEESSNG